MEIIKENKHIAIVTHPVEGVPDSSYHIVNKKNSAYLGTIEWNQPWKQNVFSSDNTIIWSNSCLEFVNKFMEELNAKLN